MEADFLVVGAGIAGVRAAIDLARAGSVLVIAKDSLRESSSEYAQGGVAVVLSDDDEIELHEQDTIYAGDGLCDPRAVHTLVEEGPEAIQELIAWGAQFDRDGGQLSFTREGAHSRNRILHSHGDSTGREIARTLVRRARSMGNIELKSFEATIDLLTDGDAVTGALVLDERSGELVKIRARAVLLATGGLGRVFAETTNPDVATGDGVAMAWRAGAEIENIEFVQFHPTALAVEGAPRFLLSEALRGEGAKLLNLHGERFMPRYHEMGELAPRDVVSRAIVSEMARTGSSHVLLDLTHRDEEFIRARFPRIWETCRRYGVDVASEAAPVRPAAHYSMGGVRTDLRGAASLKRLYAAGEAACTGVHGANRLASNSLLEALVFGRRAGTAMSAWAEAEMPRCAESEPALFPRIEETAVRKIAWRDCGIIRDAMGLRRAVRELSVGAGPGNAASLAEYEVRSIHAVAALIAECALKREESRGAHFRADYPGPQSDWQHSSVTSRAMAAAPDA